MPKRTEKPAASEHLRAAASGARQGVGRGTSGRRPPSARPLSLPLSLVPPCFEPKAGYEGA